MTSCKDITKPEENKPIKVQVEFEFEDKELRQAVIKNLKEIDIRADCLDDLIKILKKYAK